MFKCASWFAQPSIAWPPLKAPPLSTVSVGPSIPGPFRRSRITEDAILTEDAAVGNRVWNRIFKFSALNSPS